jgi:hypothetical protein
MPQNDPEGYSDIVKALMDRILAARSQPPNSLAPPLDPLKLQMTNSLGQNPPLPLRMAPAITFPPYTYPTVPASWPQRKP